MWKPSDEMGTAGTTLATTAPMIRTAAIALLTLVFAIIVPMYRRHREHDDPVRLWGRSWPTTAEAAEALACAMGLTRERRLEGSSWLASIVMAPVWILWDPMGTDIDSMRRLAPWRLVGARTSGRSVRVEFPAEHVQFALQCQSEAFFTANASRDGAPWPLDEQEGLRLLHPIGGEGWQEGTRLIQEAFALKLDRLTLRDHLLFAATALDERGPSPADYPRLLEALERIAVWIERNGRGPVPTTGHR